MEEKNLRGEVDGGIKEDPPAMVRGKMNQRELIYAWPVHGGSSGLGWAWELG